MKHESVNPKCCTLDIETLQGKKFGKIEARAERTVQFFILIWYEYSRVLTNEARMKQAGLSL